MLLRRWGRIVNITSPSATMPLPGQAYYAASKAGLVGLTRALSRELAGHGVLVNAVSPGMIETEGFSVYPPHALERFHEANPMKRLGDAWDVAEAAMYLGSDAGAFVTGEVLTIDGGMAQWGVVWPAGMPEYFNVGGGA
jgi:NAD(P)-dependent dehydrogenase (short-subunit alcohol dehydrogenase family)